jgi:7-cyano-7-deazaguanine synthase
MNKVVIALSGGLDSSTLLGVLLHAKKDVYCCIFKYPSKHNAYELQSALNIIDYYKQEGYPIHFRIFDLSSVFAMFQSNLLQQGGEIPEGHYQQDNMKLTVVPGRNAIFGTIMAGYAESLGINHIYLGVHTGDHAIYPDCRPDFIQSMTHTILLSSGYSVEVHTPFIDISKAAIVSIGIEENIPYHLTRTCYKDQDVSCGKCGSCNERLEAFAVNNLKDPIDYEFN